jgi:hypothetical protein
VSFVVSFYLSNMIPKRNLGSSTQEEEEHDTAVKGTKSCFLFRMFRLKSAKIASFNNNIKGLWQITPMPMKICISVESNYIYASPRKNFCIVCQNFVNEYNKHCRNHCAGIKSRVFF